MAETPERKMREKTEGPAGTKLPDYKGLLGHVKLELNYYQ